MSINVVIDEKLVEEAAKLVGEVDSQKIVEMALREMIRRRAKIQALLDIAGTIEFYEGYDYKALRATRYDAP